MPFDTLQDLIDAVENLQQIDALRIDGTNAMLADLDAGNFKVVNVSDATQPTDATNLQQVQSAISSTSLRIDGTNAMLADLDFGGFRPDNIPSGTASLPAYYMGNDVNTGIFSPADNIWAVSSNGNERFRVRTDGITVGNPVPDASNKLGRIYGLPYNNSDGEWLAIDIRGLNGANELVFGGGSGSFNTATKIGFKVNSNTTTISGVEKLSITSNGVGVGVTPYSNAFTSSSLDLENNVGISGSSTTFWLNSNAYYNGSTWLRKATGYACLYGMYYSDGSHKWWTTTSSSTAGTSISFTNHMTLDRDGILSASYINATQTYRMDNVDIVNTSRAWVGSGGVSTAGNIDTTAAYYMDANLIINTGRTWVGSGGVSTAGNINTTAAYSMDGVQIVNTSRAWVGSGGVVTAGNVTINNSAPTLYLQDSNHRSSMVHCNSNIWYVLRGSGTNSTTWQTVNGQWPFQLNLENNDATFGGATYHPNIRRTGGASSVLNVNSSGEMFAPASSIRYKENINDLSAESSENVLSLRPVTYIPKDEPLDENGNTNELYGLIAEEVFEVDPKLVYMNYGEDCWEEVPMPDSLLTKTILKDDAVPRIEGVHYDKIAVLLIDVVKRQKEQIQLLTQRLDNIEKLA